MRLFRLVMMVSPAETCSPLGSSSSRPVASPAAVACRIRSVRAWAFRSATIWRVGAIMIESWPAAMSAAHAAYTRAPAVSGVTACSRPRSAK